MRIGMSYYWDDLHNNTPGVHSGHNTVISMPDTDKYKGSVDFRLASFSFAQFGEKFEFLNETGFNSSHTDSTSTSRNFTQFVYGGINVTEKSTPYFVFDHIHVADNDIYVYPVEKLKIALGYRYSFNYLLNLNVQLERFWEFKHFGRPAGSEMHG